MDPREVAYKQRESNMVDGVSLNAAVVPNQYGYQSLCYSAMDAVRLANNYRPKIYAAPDLNVYGLCDSGVDTPLGIPQFSDYVTQIRMLPGTLVLGMTLAVIDFIGNTPGSQGGGFSNTFNLANNLYVSVVEDGTGIPFFSNWLSQLLFNVQTHLNDATNTNRNVYSLITHWLPFTRPRVVLDPGSVTVSFCYKGNSSTVNMAPQVILQCAEPCNVFRNSQECQ
jgi:hypothetical protein